MQEQPKSKSTVKQFEERKGIKQKIPLSYSINYDVLMYQFLSFCSSQKGSHGQGTLKDSEPDQSCKAVLNNKQINKAVFFIRRKTVERSPCDINEECI